MPSDLRKLALPEWTGTNAMPLTPDKAVEAAIKHLQAKQPGVWTLDRVELERQFGDTWTYDIRFESDKHNLTRVRVLMNGEIWLPHHQK